MRSMPPEDRRALGAGWILADPHVGANAEADHELELLLAAASRESRDLLVMGDLFRVWLGLERMLTPLQGKVLDALQEVRRSGARVVFVVGNRDYFAESQLDRAFDDVIATEAVLRVGGVPTLVTHGDLVRTDDLAYRRWRRLSRHRIASALVRSLPAPFARGLASALERKLRGTNLAYKSGSLPRADLAAFGRRVAAEGAARAIVGHFHADETIVGPGQAPVVIAPSWLDQRKILEVRPDGTLVGLDRDALFAGPSFQKTL
ncbi:MAG: hypothetical protein HYV07_10815 [Deltaproteobacteria bacterium]|nr:hypothetical protein [Deltaproteobacteria bacterium]